jgi:hypothetical protein
MNKPYIIGLHGLPGSGKDTFADTLVSSLEARGLKAVKLHFADPLRDVAEAALGSRYETQAEKAALDAFWNDHLAYHSDVMDTPKENWLGAEPVTGRRILQFIGTELFRQHVHPDFWCLCMRQRIATAVAAGAHAIAIPDVRFVNEANLIRSLGGNVLRLFNSNHPPCESQHASDKPLPDTIVNAMVWLDSAEKVQALARSYASTAYQRLHEET